MTRLGPLAMLLARPLALTVAGLLVLIEVIFLAESLTTQMENVLRVNGTPADVGLLVLLKTPEILDLALPLAFLVGVHVVIADARASGELGVFAAAGLSWRRVVGFALKAGAIGGLASFLVAGFAVPAALHAQRIALDRLGLAYIEQAVRSPGEFGTIRHFGGVEFIAASGAPGDERSTLLIYNESGGVPWRFATTRDWRITGPEADGRFRLELSRLRAYGDIAGVGGGGEDGAPRDLGRVSVDRADFAFEIADLVPPLNRSRTGKEAPVVSPAGLADPDLAAVPDAKRLARVMVRAALVPAAALIALVMVVIADFRLARYLALPLGLVLVAACDVAGPAVLTGIAPDRPWRIGLAVAGLATAYLAVPLLILPRFGEALMLRRRGGR